MEMKKAQAQPQAQVQSQSPSLSPDSARVVPLGEKNYVVKIGNEVQAKSGLRPPAEPQAEPQAEPSCYPPLTEEQLISLFSKKNKGGKKTK